MVGSRLNRYPKTSQAMGEFARQALFEVHPEPVLVGHSVLHGNGEGTAFLQNSISCFPEENK